MKKKKDKSAVDYSSFNKWWPLIIFAISFLIYANTIRFDYACDDNMYTYENVFVKKGIFSFSNIVSKGSLYGFNGTNIADYRPVTLFNFAFEKTFFGGGPKVGHFFNVLFYALICVLVFKLLTKLLKGYPIYIPVLISIAFILHPLHTEVVANIKSRDEILCMLFGFLSLHYIFKYHQINKRKYIVISGITFFLCLLSKENGFAFLGLIPLVLYFFTTESLKRISILTAPFVAITVLVVLIRSSVLDSNVFDKPFETWQNSLMAATNLSDQLATNFTIFLKALSLLIFPLKLSWDYSFNHFPIVTFTNMKVILSVIIHLALIVIAISGFKKRSIYSFAILFYFISYFITSNLVVKIGNTFADRFLFIPSLAFCIVLPFLILKLFRFDIKNKSLGGAMHILATFIVIFLLYSFKTIDRNEDWRDNEQLHASGLTTAPNSAWVHYIYARDYAMIANESEDPAEKKVAGKIAIPEFKKSIAINPQFLNAIYELGVVYASIGENENALKMFRKALAIQPDFSDALYNSGKLEFLSKNYQTALDLFNKSLITNPDNINAYLGMGACYRSLNDNKNAIKCFENVLRIAPDNTNLMRNIASLYKELGDTANANNYLRKAVKQ